MNEQTSANSLIRHPGLTRRQATLAGAILLLTLAAFAWALYTRQRLEHHAPLSLEDLTRFQFDHPHLIGMAARALIIPLALIFLLSRTRLFREMISDEAAPRDRLKLFVVLAVIQFLSLSYHSELLFLARDQVTLGLMVIIVGGLVGGWPVGLGLGLVTMLITGTRIFLIETEGGQIFFEPYRAGQIGELVCILRETLLRLYLFNWWALSAVWAGAVAGLSKDLLGKRRFGLPSTFILGIGTNLIAGYLIAIGWEPVPTPLVEMLMPSVLMTGLAMAAFALIVRNVQAEKAYQQAEAARLALTQAELRALRAQINPHFLFNALNTIRYFVRTDPATARHLLLDLSEIFQRALRSGEFVPLRDELSYVEAYLALEKARFDERLQITWAVPPGESPFLEQPVPTLIMQPIVENAVVHGVAKRSEGGTVRITIEQADGALSLQVADDGPGIEAARLAEILDPDQEENGAIGLRNVDKRLRALYGEAYCLTIESEVGRGTRVQIRIPVKGG